MTVPRVLLINPPFYRFFKQKASYFPKGLGYIAAVLEQNNVPVRIYNCDCEDVPQTVFNIEREINHFPEYIARLNNLEDPVYQEILSLVKGFKPDFVGLSATTSSYKSALNIAKLLKNEKIKLQFSSPRDLSNCAGGGSSGGGSGGRKARR